MLSLRVVPMFPSVSNDFITGTIAGKGNYTGGTIAEGAAVLVYWYSWFLF